MCKRSPQRSNRSADAGESGFGRSPPRRLAISRQCFPSTAALWPSGLCPACCGSKPRSWWGTVQDSLRPAGTGTRCSRPHSTGGGRPPNHRSCTTATVGDVLPLQLGRCRGVFVQVHVEDGLAVEDDLNPRALAGDLAAIAFRGPVDLFPRRNRCCRADPNETQTRVRNRRSPSRSASSSRAVRRRSRRRSPPATPGCRRPDSAHRSRPVQPSRPARRPWESAASSHAGNLVLTKDPASLQRLFL